MDHCSGIDTVLHNGVSGNAYNLGAREEISGVEVAKMILEIMNKPDDLISFVTDRPGHDYRYSIDPSKAEALGWDRKRTFNEGLAETVRWYLDNEPWWRNVKKKLEFSSYENKWYCNNRSL
jgi:dTDP-glucose 4,6-dehydratase